MVDVGKLPRVDIPGDWVDFVLEADRPFCLEPLFTRDPRHIDDVAVLQAMIALRGVDERHVVVSLNYVDQIVVSGTITALRKLHAQAGRAGARDVKLLDVAVASHCPPRSRSPNPCAGGPKHARTSASSFKHAIRRKTSVWSSRTRDRRVGARTLLGRCGMITS